MKRLYYVFVLCVLPMVLAAQPRWEVGVFAGGANYLGELTENRYPVWKETKPFLGLTGSYFLNRHFSIKSSLLFARLSGNDANADDPGRKFGRMVNFESEIVEGALSLVWEPFAHKRYPDSVWFKRIISPYLFTGAAVVSVRAKPDFSATPREGLIERIQMDKMEEYPMVQFSVPFGVGLKGDLGKQAMIGVEFGIRKAFTDFIDGISYTGDPSTNDWYMFGGVTYSFRIGPWDSDRDGIVDKEDRCPKLAGSSTARGCPDRDGDAVEDLEDVCPDEAGPFELAGCPDRDDDLVIDKIDQCPDEPGLEATGGCPDTDGDGVADKEDPCPETAGLPALAGCPDQDEDGIADKDDDCPEITGLAEFSGCPFPDEDKDGIADAEDDCPDLPGPAGAKGCPDADEDGIADKDDPCPDLSGTADGKGCPEMTEKIKEALTFAAESVKFATASDDLHRESLKIMEEIAAILNAYPHYLLNIDGHADSRGSQKTNLVLSEKRAKSCYDYLVKLGIDPERLSYKGYGESKPIADNNTPEGRRKNRRVEFNPRIR